jgi:hypothetical protein
MADIKPNKISDAQIEEAEQDAVDPSHEKDPAERDANERETTETAPARARQ